MDKETLDELLLAGNEEILDAYRKLDRDDPDYYEHIKILSAWHERLVKQMAIQLENERKKDELAIEADRVAVENLKVNEEASNAKKRNWIDVFGNVIGAGSLGASIWMFCRSTKFEKDNAILSTTDQTVVKGGLNNIFRNFFRK